jgi:O-antigen/teichoic acid export membrane protein
LPVAFARTAAKTAVERVRGALQTSAALIVNSGALAIATVATAVLGFAYWWLAARLFSPATIGTASAILSVIALVGLLGDAGIGTLLMGEIVRHPGRAPGLVAAAVSVGLALGVGLALSFVFGADFIGSTRLIEGWAVGVGFVLSCGLAVASKVVDQALLGSLRGTSTMIRNVLFSAFKLALIVVAAAAAGSASAIILTWMAALLASWISLDLLTRGGARRLVGTPDFDLLHSLRGKVFGHYALDVALQGPLVIVPYLVLVLLSPATTAAFASVWMLVSTAAAVPAVLATVLFPVVRAAPKQFQHLFLVSLTASLLFSLACAVFIFMFSQQILGIFNPAYPEIAGTSLRFIGFGLLGSTFKFHACTLARLGDAMGKASPWFALGGLLELGFMVAGAKLGGLEGLVLGWTLAVSMEGACVGLVWVFATKGGLAGAVREFTAPPPLQI